MRYKFIGKEDMVDGMPTLGVVYHMLRERDIRNRYIDDGDEPPKVLGYILVSEREEGEDNEDDKT
jgi:hypothetical protein